MIYLKCYVLNVNFRSCKSTHLRGIRLPTLWLASSKLNLLTNLVYPVRALVGSSLPVLKWFHMSCTYWTGLVCVWPLLSRPISQFSFKSSKLYYDVFMYVNAFQIYLCWFKSFSWHWHSVLHLSYLCYL